MKLSRREFLIVAVGLTAGCQTGGQGGSAESAAVRTVNAGPGSRYTADGVYSSYHNQGFFLVREGDKLFALSSICTHRKCALTARPDHSFYCKCHGSTFDPSGHVTKGPAKRDLPRLPVMTDDRGQVLVTLPLR